jgi:hypothetical protein
MFGLPNSDSELASLADDLGMTDLARIRSALPASLYSEAVRCTPTQLLQLNTVAIIRLRLPILNSLPQFGHCGHVA